MHKMSWFQIWCLLQVSSSFQNSLKTSGHRGYEFLEFWCWNLVLFLPDIGLHLLKSVWSSLTYFSFLPWNRRRLEGSICCSKTFIYLSAFIVLSKTCKLPIPYALMHPHTRGLCGTVFLVQLPPAPARLYPAPTRSRYIFTLCSPAVRFE